MVEEWANPAIPGRHRLALVPHHCPVKCVSVVKWPGYKDDHSPPLSAEDKNEWCHASSPSYACVVYAVKLC
jgi:hypothetical protein